jgi:uncharacterized protein YndB with AHSA1/START domain
MVAGASAKVVVTGFESPRRIAFTWDGEMQVELTFEPFADGVTKLAVAVSGLDPNELLAQATGVIEGFSIVFCDLKTLLESGESANLVRDKATLIEASQK